MMPLLQCQAVLALQLFTMQTKLEFLLYMIPQLGFTETLKLYPTFQECSQKTSEWELFENHCITV
jgi:hypothetical protein